MWIGGRWGRSHWQSQWHTIQNQFTVAPGDTVKSYNISLSAGNAEELQPADLTEEWLHFYWVDGLSGEQVSVTATVGGMTVTASTTYDVVEPTAQAITSTYGEVRLDSMGTEKMKLWLGPSLTELEGISITGVVTAPNDYPGKIGFIQTINSLREYWDSTGQIWILSTAGENEEDSWVLDTLDGVFYSDDPTGNGTVAIAGGAMGTLTITDAPSQELLVDDQYGRVNESFSDYLMYKPDGSDSIWVPLRYFDWGWDAKAVNSAVTGWSLNPANPQPDNAGEGPSLSMPEWTRHFQGDVAVGPNNGYVAVPG